jgi:hypothetical protein
MHNPQVWSRWEVYHFTLWEQEMTVPEGGDTTSIYYNGNWGLCPLGHIDCIEHGKVW